MPDFILFMHNDRLNDGGDWPAYFAKLRASGAFQGGSEIGDGACFRKGAPAPKISERLGGYMRVTAPDLEGARALIEGNPVYECGGTVEIRELPED